MPDLIAISQGLNATKVLLDIGKTIIGLRDSKKLLEATVEFNQQLLSVQKALLDAQAEQTTLVKTIRDLEKEIAELKAWETEKQKYELKDLGSAALAYVIKPEMQSSEPLHCICANCYNHGRKSFLQKAGLLRPQSNTFVCPDCKSEIYIRDWPPRNEISSTVRG